MLAQVLKRAKKAWPEYGTLPDREMDTRWLVRVAARACTIVNVSDHGGCFGDHDHAASYRSLHSFSMSESLG
jgi:hypothetical protein